MTGASSGLGEQLARALAAAGAPGRWPRAAPTGSQALRAELPGADAVTCDVTEAADRERLVDDGAGAPRAPRRARQQRRRRRHRAGAEASTEAFARVLDLNLTAPFALSCLAAAQMRAGGGGSIVNVASVMGLRSIGEIPDAAYVASKAGIIGLTRELASQWGRHGIRVNAVAPGFFASEMTAELGDDPEAFPEFLLARTPLRRGGRAGELDEAVLFLLGAGSSFVTGHVLSVDGGMSVR